MSNENIIELRPYHLHQYTENIHLRINNRDITSYPMQTLNQRMEYWRQAKLMESGGVCPHRKPSTQSTCGTTINGRSAFINTGFTYDGDMRNEVVLGDITVTGFNSAENLSLLLLVTNGIMEVLKQIDLNQGNYVMVNNFQYEGTCDCRTTRLLLNKERRKQDDEKHLKH